mmetsp:Transcript_1500/g.5898  ORF Transcript_1500/g.5898 Transcript_1500/m.5898 type:complete len:431 (-) Transcript_1500:607-1899(-)
MEFLRWLAHERRRAAEAAWHGRGVGAHGLVGEEAGHGGLARRLPLEVFGVLPAEGRGCGGDGPCVCEQAASWRDGLAVAAAGQLTLEQGGAFGRCGGPGAPGTCRVAADRCCVGLAGVVEVMQRRRCCCCCAGGSCGCGRVGSVGDASGARNVASQLRRGCPGSWRARPSRLGHWAMRPLTGEERARLGERQGLGAARGGGREGSRPEICGAADEAGGAASGVRRAHSDDGGHARREGGGVAGGGALEGGCGLSRREARGQLRGGVRVRGAGGIGILVSGRSATRASVRVQRRRQRPRVGSRRSCAGSRAKALELGRACLRGVKPRERGHRGLLVVVVEPSVELCVRSARGNGGASRCDLPAHVAWAGHGVGRCQELPGGAAEVDPVRGAGRSVGAAVLRNEAKAVPGQGGREGCLGAESGIRDGAHRLR